jgi:hypothetical protein
MSQRGERGDFRDVLKTFAARMFGGHRVATAAPAHQAPGPTPAVAAPPPSQPERTPFSQAPQRPPGPSLQSKPSKLARIRRKRLSKLRPTNLPPLSPNRSSADVEDLIAGPRKPKANSHPTGLAAKGALDLVLKTINLNEEAQAAQPTSPDPAVADHVRSRIIAGAARLTEHERPDETGYIVGFDFGTSSSKIVIHQPGAGDPTYALSVPSILRAKEQGVIQDHLWISTVWYQAQTGLFSLCPSLGATRLSGFKTGLIQGQGHRMENGVSNAVAATAYLALLIAYVVGDHATSPPSGFKRNKHFSRFHFGVPVACKDDNSRVKEFRTVLAAAFAVAPRAPSVHIDEVRAALQAANPAAPVTSETAYLLFEELAGVIAGYKASPDARRGPHVVVDVGASTLDIATFFIPDGDYRIPVLMAGVELLGADALASARRRGLPDPTFRLACIQHTRSVLSQTFLRKDRDFFPKNGIPKPLLFVGGGRRTDVHDALYGAYPEGLEAPRVTPLPGKNLAYDKKTDFARLLLAWGLSQDEIEIPELKPPSEIGDETRNVRDYAAAFVDKDQT